MSENTKIAKACNSDYEYLEKIPNVNQKVKCVDQYSTVLTFLLGKCNILAFGSDINNPNYYDLINPSVSSLIIETNVIILEKNYYYSIDRQVSHIYFWYRQSKFTLGLDVG